MRLIRSGLHCICLEHLVRAEYVPVSENTDDAEITCILYFVNGSPLNLQGDEGDRIWAQLEMLSAMNDDLNRAAFRRLLEVGQ